LTVGRVSLWYLSAVCRYTTRKCARCVKKKQVSYYRPTGRLDPNPADLAYGALELAALEYQARRGEIILLYEDETILWRFALPRAGW
jgi:hypothetical protein